MPRPGGLQNEPPTAELQRDRTGRSSAAIVVVIAVALVVVPVVVAEFPVEMGRWYAAAALELSLEKDLPAAIRRLDQAIHLDPSAPTFYLQRAKWKLYTMQLKSGLDDCDSARTLGLEQRFERKSNMPDDIEFLEEVAAVRGQFLQHLNRHQEAVAEWTQLVESTDRSHKGRMARRLNGLAYARALAKTDLEIGLAEANESLDLLGNRAVILDPGGYLHFARGCAVSDPKLALQSLNAAAGRAEKVYRENEKRAKALESRFRLRGTVRYEDRLKVLRPQLAGIYKARADLLSAMGRPKDAEVDQKRIQDLAPNGNVSISARVDLVLAIQRVSSAVNTLDTRGFLYYQMGDYTSARSDLEKAVDLAQWLETAFPWYIESRRYTILDMRPLTLAQERQTYTTVITRYHRMLVYEALDMVKEADEDRSKIRELGMEPGEHLF